MSLQTDKIFFYALKGNSQLAEMLGAEPATETTEATEPRIFTTAIPRAYYANVEAFVEPVDNCKLPYIIVSFDGLVNNRKQKDPLSGWRRSSASGRGDSSRGREEVAEMRNLSAPP